MQQNNKGTWLSIGLIAELAAIIALAVMQLWQDKKASESQDSAQATQIALLREQLNVQHDIATLQASSSGWGPASTLVAQRIVELEGTRVAIQTKEAVVVRTPRSDTTMTVQANVEWANTGIMVNEGETVNIAYVSGQWRGAVGGYWSDGNDCAGASNGVVPNAGGHALIARVATGNPLCVGYSPFVSSNSGILFLTYNDCPQCFSDNEGSVTVCIQVFR